MNDMATMPEGEGRLADNLLQFCRTLRRAGLPIGPGQIVEAGQAALRAGLSRRDDFYYALRSVLVTDRGQSRLFDQAFYIYFRNPRLLERMLQLMLPTLERAEAGGQGDNAIRRLLESLAPGEQPDSGEAEFEADHSATWSRREVLRQRDFEQMSLEEQLEARELMRDELQIMRKVATRRFRPHPFGDRFDLRRSMRLMLKNNGQLIELARRKRRQRPPALVLLCDISGSMSRYSRVFLQFAHLMTLRWRDVHSFVFGTRLTNISHRLQNRDVDLALSQVANDVPDWDGGTRIGDCLQRFNRDWGRRVLAGRAVVVLLTDGLERDSAATLSFEMQRLRQSCEQLIWLNPMLRYAEFEPRATGIRAMLPHADLFLPAHNLESLAALGRVLGEHGGRRGRRPT